jgi:cell shape-determining protein MreC
MLIRISLIVAILAGLAVGVLNFVVVKDKVSTLETDLTTTSNKLVVTTLDLTSTKSDLKKTSAELKQTKTELEATTAAKEKADADVASLTKQKDKLTDDLNKTRQERDTAQQDLAAYKATGTTPQQILGFTAEIKGLKDNLAVSDTENKVLARNNAKLQTQLDRFLSPDKPVLLPASLKGKVLVADPKWNFVVLNVGEDQGVLEYGELLVNRDGRLVAKVVVRSVQKDRCIANVMPGWELGEVMEGDLVIPAHPAS